MRFTQLDTTGWLNHPERGGTFAEAAIITPCLLVVLFVCIQFMFISFRALSLQWITTEVMRDLALSRCDPSLNNPDCTLYTTGGGTQLYRTRSRLLRLHYAKLRARQLAAPLGIDLAPLEAASCVPFQIQELSPPSTGATPPTDNCINIGSPGSLLQVDLTYQMPLFFSKVAFVSIPPLQLRGRAIARVESFPQIN